MTRTITVHLVHDDPWLQAFVGVVVTDEDGCYVRSDGPTHLSVTWLPTAKSSECRWVINLASSLASTLGVPLFDKDGEPWTADALHALTKELAA